MDKRALAALPRPEAKEQYNDLRQGIPQMKGIVEAERIKVGEKDTLVINCFKAEKKAVTPWFRTFCQEEEYITQDLTDQKTKWKTGAFNYIAGFFISDTYRVESNLAPADPQTENIIINFMQEWMERNHTNRCDAGFKFEDYIYAYQADIRERKLADKHRKICEKIDKRMELFGELPDDYQQFIEDTVFDEYNYFFYSLKEKRAYCTRCRHEYEIRKEGIYHRRIPLFNDRERPKHNKLYCCPHCNKLITAKSEGYSRGSLLEANWSVLIQTSGDDVLVRYFCHSKDFRRDFKHPEVKSRELFRSIHTADHVEDYEWETYTYSNKVRWCYPKGHVYLWNPSKFQLPKSTVLYNADFGSLSNTCMRYSCIGDFINHVYPMLYRKSPWIVDSYFNFYRRHPFIEQMIKIGWHTLVKELYENDIEIDRDEFINGRSILETCGVTREQFLILKEATNNDPKARDFEIIKYAALQKVKITVDNLRVLRYIPDNGIVDSFKRYVDMMKYTTLHKLKRYLNKQNIGHAQDYFDYTKWILEMGYNMKNEYNLFPRDFRKRHDEMSKIYIKFRDKRHKEDIKKFNCILRQMRKEVTKDNPVNLQDKGLFIRLPYQIEELKTEGEKLRHCVGSYIDNVLKGETTIFFVRRTEKPDVPYYTLEWRNHRVVQCRGFDNDGMTPEVKEFVTVFAEQMKAYELQKGWCGYGQYKAG